MIFNTLLDKNLGKKLPEKVFLLILSFLIFINIKSYGDDCRFIIWDHP